MTKCEHPVPILTQFAPIFGVPLVNKVPHLVGIFKNEQRGAMRHGPPLIRSFEVTQVAFFFNEMSWKLAQFAFGIWRTAGGVQIFFSATW